MDSVAGRVAGEETVNHGKARRRIRMSSAAGRRAEVLERDAGPGGAKQSGPITETLPPLGEGGRGDRGLKKPLLPQSSSGPTNRGARRDSVALRKEVANSRDDRASQGGQPVF